MLKWTGALAGAAVAGAVVGVGADMLLRPTPPQEVCPTPPPTISYKPPLSPQVQDRVNTLVNGLVASHDGESVTYSVVSEWPPGGYLITGRVVKVHVKNGIVTAVEPGDYVNSGIAVEDKTIPWKAVLDDQIQHRPVARDLAISGHLYNPRRMLYPMKRVSGSRGKMGGRFVRISWDEALTTIANKMIDTQNKYGNYSIYNNPVGSWQGCDANGWASDSSAAHQTSMKFTFGVGYGGGSAGTAEVTAVYDAKLIVLWGWNASVTAGDGVYNAQTGYHLRLARERGIPIIAIDPIFNESAQLLADQWIPIRVSTDVPMGLAVANVLFKEDLYDHDFVSKWVEPNGFQKFKDYVLGNTPGPDGAIDRTPEWAAPICGVPADTIRAFARLYASSKPTYLVLGEAPCSKQPKGENAARLFEYLNAMTGNIGKPGTHSSDGGWPISPVFAVKMPFIDLGTSPPTFSLPKAPHNAALFMNWKFPDAVMLRYKVDNGQMAVKDYCNSIGLMPGQPLPNIRMGFDNVAYVTICNQRPQTNYTYQAISTLDFWVSLDSNSMDPGGRVGDIILPMAVWPENEPTFVQVANGFFYMPRIITPSGEAKSLTWLKVQLANKLGIGDKFSSKLSGIALTGTNPDSAWDTAYENLAKDAYNKWASANSVSMSWDDFRKVGYYMFPIDPLSHPASVQFAAQIQQNEPFPDTTNSANHVSGKIEFYSDWLATTDMSQTWWGGTIAPTAMWEPVWSNYWTPAEFQKYPLLLTTAHPMHRMHNWTDANALTGDVAGAGKINGEDLVGSFLYLSPVDAVMRGIKDGDRVRVYNSSGQAILTALVKPTLTPGIAHLPEGRWNNLNAAGVDVRGCANNLTYADRKNPSSSFPHMSICEVEKY